MRNKIAVILVSFMSGFIGVQLGRMASFKSQPHVIKYTIPTKIDSSYIVSHVTLTCYQPVKSQCDGNPLVTSDGSKINLHHLEEDKVQWCAISRDLLYLFPKDKPKKILIKGYGLYEVRDVMNSRHRHRVDILIHPKDSRRIMKQNVEIKILK